MAEKVKMYEKEMSKCLCKALDAEVPLAFNEKFFATTVFIPTLVNDMRGANNVEICCIEGFDIPEYSDQDTAIASLDNLTIPDDNREKVLGSSRICLLITSTSMPSRTLRSSVVSTVSRTV